ncbi:MAG: IS1182 family transposase [Bacteroidetes bacterium]|nr:IS1182 family transposase [Bacteroidota bacterium]
MQGKKDYSEKLFTNFQLSDRVPKDNFYRRLKDVLDLNYLYKETEHLYGKEGQKSIDVTVFFKICLVGFFENIISDRQLMNFCSMRLDVMYFLGYDIDEPLPWYSTISRTHKLIPDDVFVMTFEKILTMCVEKGMVGGKNQAIDSAPIKANASMDTLELKVPEDTLEDHLRKVRYMSTPDRKPKINKAPKEQQEISASDRELKEIKSRNKKWSKDQDQRPGVRSAHSKYTSNKTHYSPTDPDARISVKPGKARKLNYHAQMAVDTDHHVITHIAADFADKKDNQSLQAIVAELKPRLQKNGLIWRNVLADTGYSSGEEYAFLEQQCLQSYIPPHGTFKGGPEGFCFDQENNQYQCPQGKWLTFRGTKINDKGKKVNSYSTSRADCKGCPMAEKCKGKSFEKRVTVTYYREEYERAIERLQSKQGRYLMNKRKSTVEPVFGTLKEFRGLRKLNTIGISQANKKMLMSATAYNLKKYLKFTAKQAMSQAKALRLYFNEKTEGVLAQIITLYQLIFRSSRFQL